MVARSTFFMANWVEMGWPVGGVIHDGGAAGAAAAVGGGAIATGPEGSLTSSPTTRMAPQLTQRSLPGSL